MVKDKKGSKLLLILDQEDQWWHPYSHMSHDEALAMVGRLEVVKKLLLDKLCDD